MTTQFLGPDPIQEQLDSVMQELRAGAAPTAIEHRFVVCKEEPGRRGSDGAVLPGVAENEAAARYLAGEAACFANTPGGGALVIGASDDGRLIGTELDAEWLRFRIYQLTDQRLTVTAYPADVGGARMLILRVPEALEPIAYKGKLTWRVADNCVPVDTASWYDGRLHRLGSDWSAKSSGYTSAEARATALEIARDYLRASSDPANTELAAQPDGELLARLNLATADGYLTNAGALLLIGRDVSACGYIRRDAPGGDSRRRLNAAKRGVLEELRAIEDAIDAYNPTEHVYSGLVAGQVRPIPTLAAREAVVNAVAHRDWLPLEPIVIEHVGSSLVVNNPGGFVGGVTAENIITHPSQTRNRLLADVLAKLGVAEREGIGVDRMVRDMLRFGHPRPIIEEVAGPRVRAALVGSKPDTDWIAFVGNLEPAAARDNVDSLLLLLLLQRQGWIDADIAAPSLQKTVIETTAAIDTLASVSYDRRPVIRRVPVAIGAPAYRFADHARHELAPRLQQWLPGSQRDALILGWARHRGRGTTTEVPDIAGTTVPTMAQALKSLEDDGLVTAGRANRQGRGFFYLPV